MWAPAMRSGRERLRRTADGRFECGVFIEKDKYAQYVAHVLVANRHESVTHQAKVMAPEPTFELAAMAAREWAKDHITKIFEVKKEDLVFTLLDEPDFEARARARGVG